MKVKSITKPKRSKKNKKIKIIDPDNDVNLSKNKFNLKPKSLQQEFCGKIKELAKAKTDLSEHLKNPKKNKNKFKNLEQTTSDEPTFKRRRNESDDNFMRRVDRETSDYLHKVKMEEKFEMNDFKDILAQKSEKKEGVSTRHAKKMIRLKTKKSKQKEKKVNSIDDKNSGFEKLKDKIEFGDVAMQPPSLNITSNNKNKNLLLTKMFPETSKRPIKMTEELSMDRQRAIDFYRRVKSDKYVTHFKNEFT